MWRDPYTHRGSEQRKSMTWYVHKDGTRAPNYSGIDITCGSEEAELFGGLLLKELDQEQRWVFQRIVRGNHQPFPRQGNKWCTEEKLIIQESIHRANITDTDGALKLLPAKEGKGYFLGWSADRPFKKA